MRISDWSSDVCSSDLEEIDILQRLGTWARGIGIDTKTRTLLKALDIGFEQMITTGAARKALIFTESRRTQEYLKTFLETHGYRGQVVTFNGTNGGPERSEEHTSELQALKRISYAVFCLK